VSGGGGGGGGNCGATCPGGQPEQLARLRDDRMVSDKATAGADAVWQEGRARSPMSYLMADGIQTRSSSVVT
jgi:hypothetical protein